MEINVFIILLMLIYIFICFKKKKVILSLPYLIMVFFTGIYNILDSQIFVEVFGCGCVEGFNANYLRRYIYIALVLIISFIAVLLSKRINKKKLKIIYIISSVCVNILLAFEICKLYLWQ